MIVKIPFLARWITLLISGQKICTARTRRFGDVGDEFVAFGHKFRIESLTQTPLRVVRDTFYEDEGCTTPQEFEEVWCQIHPRAGFREEQLVWLHSFCLVGPEKGGE